MNQIASMQRTSIITCHPWACLMCVRHVDNKFFICNSLDVRENEELDGVVGLAVLGVRENVLFLLSSEFHGFWEVAYEQSYACGFDSL